LAHGDTPHVVQVAGLQVHGDRVEVVTVDAGLDFQRDWLEPLSASKQCLFERQEEALKLARTCLKAFSPSMRLAWCTAISKATTFAFPSQMTPVAQPCL
jgi:hypothetical protein